VRNPFLDGSFPEQVVLENDLCVFVRTPQPVLKGSGLIVTRAPRETVFDLTEAEWAATYDLLQEVKAYLDRTLEPDGYNVGWNVGRVGGQSIPHVHLHVIPRFADEPLAGKGIRYFLKQPENKRP
jgi:diadenosine tetraphosphate (Ap4A) HIT family hydrolase